MNRRIPTSPTRKGTDMHDASVVEEPEAADVFDSIYRISIMFEKPQTRLPIYYHVDSSLRCLSNNQCPDENKDWIYYKVEDRVYGDHYVGVESKRWPYKSI